MDDEPLTDETQLPAHLRQEAAPEAQAQAAREQSIERLQDELDASGIEEAPGPEDIVDLPSRERLLEQATLRAPRA